MANIENLKTDFDINNIDLKKILLLIDQQKNTFVKIVLIVGSLLVAGLIINDYHAKVQAFNAKISMAQKKIQVLKVRDVAVQNFNDFQSSLPPKLSEVDMITVVSDYAKSCNITVNSLSPADVKDMGLYDQINVKLEAQSNIFKDMMLFLRKIERSHYPLRIESWTGRENADGKIAFTVLISAVLIHS